MWEKRKGAQDVDLSVTHWGVLWMIENYRLASEAGRDGSFARKPDGHRWREDTFLLSPGHIYWLGMAVFFERG